MLRITWGLRLLSAKDRSTKSGPGRFNWAFSMDLQVCPRRLSASVPSNSFNFAVFNVLMFTVRNCDKAAKVTRPLTRVRRCFLYLGAGPFPEHARRGSQ